jgi:hypothetical protein
MNLTKMIDELRTERESIGHAILVLERIASGAREKAREAVSLDDERALRYV